MIFLFVCFENKVDLSSPKKVILNFKAILEILFLLWRTQTMSNKNLKFSEMIKIDISFMYWVDSNWYISIGKLF